TCNRSRATADRSARWRDRAGSARAGRRGWPRETGTRCSRRRLRSRPSRAASLLTPLRFRRTPAPAPPRTTIVAGQEYSRVEPATHRALPALVGDLAAWLFGGQRFLAKRQTEALPDLQQGFGELIDQAVVVIGRRRDPQPLGALGDGRIIDRLDVDAVLFQQDVAGPLAAFGVADEQWHDMGIARHHRQSRRGQDRLDAGGALLMALAFPIRGLEVPDRSGRRRADRRWQRRREDEAGGVGAHRIDHLRASGDIAAEAAERLGERAFQDIDTMHDAVALGD